MMDIGKLRHRIELQEPQKTSDEFGGRQTIWKTFAAVWADVQPLQGRELERAKSFGATVSVTITLRFNARVNTTHRVRYGCKSYVVNAAIDEDSRHVKTILYCTELI